MEEGPASKGPHMRLVYLPVAARDLTPRAASS
jgi:hypothetical protein